MDTLFRTGCLLTGISPEPAVGGRMRDLVVGAAGLSNSALIQIVASGMAS